MPKIFLADLSDGYEQAIAGALDYITFPGQLRSGLRVAIKPNLTFPEYRPGVMTNPEAVRALVARLSEVGCRVTICEADSGGYNRFSMNEVFRVTGLADMAAEYGARLVNLSYQPSRLIEVSCGLRRLKVPLPRLLVEETDLFITMPVPKVHANTVLSGAIKNQWGVIQDPAERLKLHPYFNAVIYAVNRALPPALVIMDGKYGLNRNGPMRGEPVKLDWLLGADDLYAADRVMAELVGMDWRRVGHLVYYSRRRGAAAWQHIQFNTDYRKFKRARFELRRQWTDWPGWLTFHSRWLAWLGYESAMAKSLHRALYLFREPFY